MFSVIHFRFKNALQSYGETRHPPFLVCFICLFFLNKYTHETNRKERLTKQKRKTQKETTSEQIRICTDAVLDRKIVLIHLPIVQTDIALYCIEAEIEVVHAGGIGHFGSKLAVLLQ